MKIYAFVSINLYLFGYIVYLYITFILQINIYLVDDSAIIYMNYWYILKILFEVFILKINIYKKLIHKNIA